MIKKLKKILTGKISNIVGANLGVRLGTVVFFKWKGWVIMWIWVHEWLSGEKGDLNDAGDNFYGTYAEGVWFQNSLEETRNLLEEAGFTVLHYEDTTDIVDRGMHARLRELQMSKVYLKSSSEVYFHKSIRYFKIMMETHYRYLKYGRFICRK